MTRVGSTTRDVVYLVHVLVQPFFDAVRLDRNRNKITLTEQQRLRSLSIAVVGLSVGHVIAHCLVLEGLWAGFASPTSTSSTSRTSIAFRPGVADVGLNKCIVVGRRIAELDPFLPVEVCLDERRPPRISRSLLDGIDVLVEECDSLDVKLLVREQARRASIPVSAWKRLIAGSSMSSASTSNPIVRYCTAWPIYIQRRSPR